METAKTLRWRAKLRALSRTISTQNILVGPHETLAHSDLHLSPQIYEPRVDASLLLLRARFTQ